MKKMINRFALLLVLTMVLVAAASTVCFAESTEIKGTAEFTGDSIESTFGAGDLAQAVTDLQPGDDVTLVISYKNSHNKDTNWYMANEVIQTLEKANAARKVPEGTGTPEGGGYTYELVQTDGEGNTKTLFSSKKVGGEATPGDLQGLEQATNALGEWFYLDTLPKGGSGTITLHVEFEGETEVNDYMDTDGSLAVAFAVDIAKPDSDEPGDDVITTHPDTGDPYHLAMYLAILAVGIVLLVFVIVRWRKENRDEK